MNAEEMLRTVAEGTAPVTGRDFFYSLVRHLALALGVRYAFLTECLEGMTNRARALAFWKRDGFGENFEYDIGPTPCREVLEGKTSYHPDQLQARFPEDKDLVELAAESYLGIPLLDSRSQVIGHLAVLDDKPMGEDSQAMAVLKVFAARAGAELERLAAERKLRGALAEVETLNTRVEETAARYRTLLEINNAIMSNLTQDALFHAIAQALRRVLPFERTAIFLHEPEKDVLRLFVLESSLPSSYFVVGLEIPSGDSHVGWVFQRQRPLLRHDLERERQFPAEEMAVADGVRSYVIVPLIARGKNVGVLAVASTARAQYTESDASLLQEVANQVALAVENMKAYEEIAGLKARLEQENVYLQEEIRREHNFDEMVGSSPALLEALRKVERVAPTDATVLVLGETGTGKELIARAIHNRGARRDRPLVKVNCGAISAGLVESELFGHVKGAFTGAIEHRVGRFELADGGTLFLDEVSELPLETQVKLLRVLQEQEFEAVGSSRTVRVDVRIIAASNRDLEEAVRSGRFRSDLFYRLNVFPIRVPPLRERRSDVPPLVMFLLERFGKRFGGRILTVSQDTMNLLVNYPWPGNIRELQNVIERGVVLSQGPVLTLDRDLLPVAPDARATSAGDVRHGEVEPPPARSAPSEPPSLEDVERRHILAVLDQTGGVIEGPRGAARILNLHPNTLRSRMKKLGIRRPTHDSS